MEHVRTKIVGATRLVHLELHSDPVLCCLTDPHVTLPAYLRALAVFHSFYHHIECERQNLSAWCDLSLSRECDALSADLPDMRRPGTSAQFADKAEMLGGLYVAMGASFGRQQFKANIAMALPAAPSAFVRLRTPKDTWRSVLSYLELHGADASTQKRIATGAQKSFAIVKALTATTADLTRAVEPDARKVQSHTDL